MTCKITECIAPVKAKGYCKKHYQKKFTGEEYKRRQDEKYKKEFDSDVFKLAFSILKKHIVQYR